MLDLQKPLSRLLQRLFGNQAHDFTAGWRDSISFRLTTHEFVNAMNWRLLEVSQVHRNLGLAANQKPRSFHEAQTTSREADGLGYFFCYINVWSVQENVVSDEELACSHDAGAGSLMQPTFSEVRLASGNGDDFFANHFELSTPNIFEVLALWRSCSCFVEIHGNLVTFPDLLTHMARHGHTILILTPSIGMNGMTSAAPRRGCAPLCVFRSINSDALPTPRIAASWIASRSPARVITQRL